MTVIYICTKCKHELQQDIPSGEEDLDLYCFECKEWSNSKEFSDPT